MRNKSNCKNCYSSKNKVTQEPCCKCNEIHLKIKGFDNQFLDKEKDLMKGC